MRLNHRAHKSTAMAYSQVLRKVVIDTCRDSRLKVTHWILTSKLSRLYCYSICLGIECWLLLISILLLFLRLFYWLGIPCRRIVRRILCKASIIPVLPFSRLKLLVILIKFRGHLCYLRSVSPFTSGFTLSLLICFEGNLFGSIVEKETLLRIEPPVPFRLKLPYSLVATSMVLLLASFRVWRT